nr:tyrosine-type recombinase/integrase [Chloroflexia bacterium]
RRSRPYWHHEAGAALHAESDAAGLPRIRMHDLRHTNATILIAAGVPITVVAERLGHARVSMTLDRYAHVLEGMQERAADTISRLFDGPRDHDVTTASDVVQKTAPPGRLHAR